jgi:hypothetical protein
MKEDQQAASGQESCDDCLLAGWLADDSFQYLVLAASYHASADQAQRRMRIGAPLKKQATSIISQVEF